MSRTKRVKILLIAICIIILSSTGATASDTDIYVKKIYNADFPDLFEQYNEYKLIHTQTLSSIQGVTKLNQNTKNYVDIIVEILNICDEMNTLSISDNPDSHVTALEKASTIGPKINKLKSYESADKKGYPLLMNLALTRYYQTEATYFQELAGNEANTQLRIKYLDNSAIAYKNAGNLKLYSELSYTAKEEKQTYNSDMKIASELISNARDVLNYQPQPYSISDFIYQTNTFIDGSESKVDVHYVIDIHKKHGTEDVGSMVGMYNQLFGITMESFMKTTHYIAVFSILYIIVSLYMLYSITKWTTDMTNADYGNELLGGLEID